MDEDERFKEEPPWGWFAAEQYLIRHWNHSSPLSSDDQRQQIIRDFIQEDEIPADLDPRQKKGVLPHTPTEDEISHILQPWRPQRLRKIAKMQLTSSTPVIIVRTNYSGKKEDDAKLAEWLKILDDDCDGIDCLKINSTTSVWTVLDDPELFNVGHDLEKVYDILPELAAGSSHRIYAEHNMFYEIEDRLNHCIRPTQEPCMEDYEDAISECAAGFEYLLVLDEDAFETDTMRLLFRDGKGNIVRESEFEVPLHFDELVLRILRGSMWESGLWQDGDVGKKYRTKGEIMMPLLDKFFQSGRPGTSQT